MRPTRFAPAAVLVAAIGFALPVQAQTRTDSARLSDTTQRGPSAGEGEREYPFEGIVATVDPDRITIDAKGVPGFGTSLATLPYRLRDSAQQSRFHVGDHVTGVMVVRKGRTFVRRVEPGRGTDTGKTPADSSSQKS